jgi:hypothetical protein
MCGISYGAIVAPMSKLARSLVAASALLSLAAAATPGSEQVGLLQGNARVGGLWCGAGLLQGFSLDISQQYQALQARLVRKNRIRQITGHVDGMRVVTDPQRDHTMELLAQGNELRITAATGVLALAKGQFFTRAVGGSCTH